MATVDKSKRNRNAGKNPSYRARGMSEESIRKKRAYDKKYHATTERKKYRAELNAANKKAQKEGRGKVGDSRDQSHKKNGKLTSEKQSTNRARNGSGKGGKRTNTKK